MKKYLAQCVAVLALVGTIAGADIANPAIAVLPQPWQFDALHCGAAKVDQLSKASYAKEKELSLDKSVLDLFTEEDQAKQGLPIGYCMYPIP